MEIAIRARELFGPLPDLVLKFDIQLIEVIHRVYQPLYEQKGGAGIKGRRAVAEDKVLRRIAEDIQRETAELGKIYKRVMDGAEDDDGAKHAEQRRVGPLLHQGRYVAGEVIEPYRRGQGYQHHGLQPVSGLSGDGREQKDDEQQKDPEADLGLFPAEAVDAVEEYGMHDIQGRPAETKHLEPQQRAPERSPEKIVTGIDNDKEACHQLEDVKEVFLVPLPYEEQQEHEEERKAHEYDDEIHGDPEKILERAVEGPVIVIGNRQGADHFAVHEIGHPDADDVLPAVFYQAPGHHVMARMVPHGKIAGREAPHPPDLHPVKVGFVRIGDLAKHQAEAFPREVFVEDNFFPEPAYSFNLSERVKRHAGDFPLYNIPGNASRHRDGLPA